MLIKYNKWRRGDERYELMDTRQLGIALDIAIDALNNLDKTTKKAKK